MSLPRSLTILVAGALLVSGCSREPTAEEELIADAKAAVAATLKDPDSAKFRAVVADVDNKLVCGEVNGKNSYGAYAGYSAFFSDQGYAQIAEPGGILWDHYVKLCAGPSVEAEIDKVAKDGGK